MNQNGYSDTNFEGVGTLNDYFTIDEAVQAHREVTMKSQNDETTRKFVNYSQNTLKIVLGLALVFKNDILFDETVQ